jgi:hypothetical protein
MLVVAGVLLAPARGALAVTPIPIPKERTVSSFGSQVWTLRDSVAVTPIPIPKQQPAPQVLQQRSLRSQSRRLGLVR